LLFKFSGLLIIFSVCNFSGMYKSLLLRKRAEKLSYITRAVDDMAERIRSQACEVKKLISTCFENSTVYITNGKIEFNSNFLEKSDIDLLEEFFADFGMRDVNGEYERARFYKKLLQKQYEQAENKCGTLCRLYNSLGVLSGIFLCIFLL